MNPDLQRVREALDEGVSSLDDATRQRLADARRAAVAASQSGPRWRTFALPAAALAVALALAIGIRTSPAPLPAPAPTADVAEYAKALEVATESDATALDEDLEFYAWLDSQAQGG